MKLLTALLYAVFITTSVSSQVSVFKEEIDLHNSLVINKESYPIVNEEGNGLSIYLFDSDSISGFSFDNRFNVLSREKLERPDSKYTKVLGHFNEDNKLHFLFSRRNNQEFCLKTIDELGSERKIKFKGKNEKFIESFSYKGRLLLLYLVRNTSVVKLYEIKHDGFHLLVQHECKMAFGNAGEGTLEYVLTKGGKNSRHQLIDNTVPNPLDVTRNLVKIYFYDGRVVITTDILDDYTCLVFIDLDNAIVNTKYFRSMYYSNLVKSNSFVIGDILLQLKVTHSNLWIGAWNMLSDELINEYNYDKSETIDILNTGITQEGGGLPNIERELDKTKQLLRKMAGSNVALSAYKNRGGKIELTVGSYEIANNSTMMPFMPGVPIASVGTGIGNLTLSFNPMMAAMNGYKSSKMVYFKTLLNPDTFTHEKGVVGRNVFERIARYSDIYSGLSTETLFRMNDNYFYGYYDKSMKVYQIKRF